MRILIFHVAFLCCMRAALSELKPSDLHNIQCRDEETTLTRILVSDPLSETSMRRQKLCCEPNGKVFYDFANKRVPDTLIRKFTCIACKWTHCPLSPIRSNEWPFEY